MALLYVGFLNGIVNDCIRSEVDVHEADVFGGFCNGSSGRLSTNTHFAGILGRFCTIVMLLSVTWFPTIPGVRHSRDPARMYLCIGST